MLTVGDIFYGHSVDLDYKGQGIVKHQGYVVFVKGMLDDEEAKIKITQIKKNYGQGVVLEIVKASPDRVEAVEKELGSCDLIHVSPVKQLRWQQKITQETFKKIMNLDIEVHETLTDHRDQNYRNKSVFHVMDTSHLTLGLYNSDNTKLIPVDQFILSDLKTNRLLKMLAQSRPVINPKVLKYMMFRTNLKQEILVTLVATKPLFHGREQLINQIREITNVVGITVNINDDPNRILGKKSIVIYGENLITEPIGDIEMMISDQSFFQINLPVIEKAYALIKQEIPTGQKIIDAYSGVGSIGFYLAKEAEKVIMIESNIESSSMAKLAKEKYGFDQVEIIDEKAEKVIKHFDGDYLIVDPPRNGLMESFIQTVLKQNYKKIFYLSCDVKTLVRDISLLSGQYEIKDVYPIRMFFHTSSLETLAILNHK
ncbi:MAG: 23S rRNA (uracil(1939)-C(5))-methyltransferase RlmD [Acholeplasmataceae bacterium]|nr:23S rRNA (uracil(1939)-C(5))-methyltransferase RlmD [Acholeplasmataceae bacterium]